MKENIEIGFLENISILFMGRGGWSPPFPSGSYYNRSPVACTTGFSRPKNRYIFVSKNDNGRYDRENGVKIDTGV